MQNAKKQNSQDQNSKEQSVQPGVLQENEARSGATGIGDEASNGLALPASDLDAKPKRRRVAITEIFDAIAENDRALFDRLICVRGASDAFKPPLADCHPPAWRRAMRRP